MYGATMAKLCLQLAVEFDRDVIDKTGIVGAYDIPFEWSPAEPGASGDGRDSAESEARWLTDVQNSLARAGLKLAQAKGPGEFLVIDRVERPSGN
jgi:uncharacterized protein (TIGR03435 family)